MQRIEVQHHTPEQVRDYLAEAWEIVCGLGLPQEHEQAAFVEATRLLSSKTVQAVAAPQGMFVPPMG